MRPTLGTIAVLAALVVSMTTGCTSEEIASDPIDATPDFEPWFTEIALESGLDWRHHNGATGSFYYPELMQGGGALVDIER